MIWDRMKAARVNKQGGIEEIDVVDVPVPTPKPEEILIKTEWAGVNFSRSRRLHLRTGTDR